MRRWKGLECREVRIEDEERREGGGRSGRMKHGNGMRHGGRERASWGSEGSGSWKWKAVR